MGNSTKSLIESALNNLYRAKQLAEQDEKELARRPDDRRPRNDNECVSFVLQANSEFNWMIGRCGFAWQSGRRSGIDEFCKAIGGKQQEVEERIRIHGRFGATRGDFPNLRFAHFAVAMDWDDEDAAETLKWANDMEATPAEMRAWHRAQHGQPFDGE